MAVTYKTFKTYHEDYDPSYWKILRAFYKGGKALLRDKKVLEEVFPKNYGESKDVYKDRKERAFFECHPSEIVDKLVGNVVEQKLSVSVDKLKVEADFYQGLTKDTSRPGGKEVSLNSFLKEQLLESLQCQYVWTQVALPKAPLDEYGNPVEFINLEEEEKAGMNRAYLISRAAEEVINWRDDGDGTLRWLVTCHDEDPMTTFDSDPNVAKRVYTVWTPQTWTEYTFIWNLDQKGQPDDEDTPTKKSGEHSFGCVPFVPLNLPYGLWAMNKIESTARAYFNIHNSLGWAECRNLFPILAAFLQGEESGTPVSSDMKRGKNQHMGPGHASQFAEKDRLEFVTPPSDPYHFTLTHLEYLRDEMHRVVHQMAQSVNNSPSAHKRSGKSKEMDAGPEQVVSNELGGLIRDHVMRVLNIVAKGRGEEPQDWPIEGMEGYQVRATSAMVEDAVLVGDINIPSPTFQREYKARLAKRLIGHDLKADDAIQIDEELKKYITEELFTPEAQMAKELGGAAVNKDDKDQRNKNPSKKGANAQKKAQEK